MENPPYAFVLPKWVRHSKSPISSVDIHPSGEIFATGGWDNFVKIWNFQALSDPVNVKHKLIALLRDHTHPINCVRFSPDGKYLASCGLDSNVFLWQRVRTFGAPSTFGIQESALQPNKPIQRWSSRTLSGNTRDVSQIAWCPNSQKIASCSIDGVVIIWDVKSGTVLRQTSDPVIGPSLSIAWDPLDRFIVVQSSDSHLVFLDSHGMIIPSKSKQPECLETSEESMVSRITWTPDGSYIGCSGRSDQPVASFFRRESFNVAFAMEGHVQTITCLACPPFLLKSETSGGYSSLCAVIDKSGTLSVWVIGESTRPLFVISNISTSASSDIVWSKDGKWLLIALDSDTVTREGGLLCLRIMKDLPYEKVDQAEFEELRGRLVGETTFKPRAAYSANAAEILQSLEVKEREVDLEVLRLTTEEVLERQIETVVNGVRHIKPVLMTAVEKHTTSFQCHVKGKKPERVPYEMRARGLVWPKPAAMSAPPTHTVTLDDCLVVASDMSVFKLAKDTGMRISTPFVIGAKCKHLSVEHDVVLAVGKECYVLELSTMKCLFSCDCPSQFTDFKIISEGIIMGHSRGKVWLYDQSVQAWVGGVLSNTVVDTTMEEVEKYASWNEQERSAAQWFDFGVSAMFSAYSGDMNQVTSFVDEMKAHDEGSESKDYIARIERVIESRWMDGPQ